jgi:hypothetical protein
MRRKCVHTEITFCRHWSPSEGKKDTRDINSYTLKQISDLTVRTDMYQDGTVCLSLRPDTGGTALESRTGY